MEHMQKAALSLHGMHIDDRQWLLERLPEAHRAPLVSMLDELEQLGIPREPMLLEEAEAPAPDAPVHPVVDRLRDQDARRLCDVLEAEPDAVIIGLVTGAAWPWTNELLQALPSTRREAIAAALADTQTAPPGRAFVALCESALQVLQQTMNREAEPDDEPTTRRWRLLEYLPWRR